MLVIDMDRFRDGFPPCRSVSLLPARIYQLAAGDTSALEPLLRLYFGNIAKARVMHFAINCTDDPATQADLEAKVPALYEHLYRENVQDSLDACAALDVPQLPDSSDALVTSRTWAPHAFPFADARP